MPTAAKLMGAILFGLLGALVALRIPDFLPEGMRSGLLLPTTAAVSGFLGWRVAGTRSGGQSYGDAAATGLLTVALATFSLLLIFGLMEMLHLTERMVYKGPVEAVVGIFEQMLKLAPVLLNIELLGIMAIGGLLSGLACEAAGRRWN